MWDDIVAVKVGWRSRVTEVNLDRLAGAKRQHAVSRMVEPSRHGREAAMRRSVRITRVFSRALLT
jgi:hypothetical protein